VSTEPRLQTRRLLLRRWQETDLRPFAALNADPTVMEHFPRTLSTKESAALVERFEAGFEQRGYGFWAVETTEQERPFIGYVGISPAALNLPFAPAVEVGWRLARAYWGRGYATEAASAAIAFGFDRLHLQEIVSYTASVNLRSQKVMKRLGMQRDPREDFEHPRLPEGDPLRAHVLYRVNASAARTAIAATER
jgi:RimJ/RimL family protein N-acetyltransferase